jgi:hypothetical protein
LLKEQCLQRLVLGLLKLGQRSQMELSRVMMDHHGALSLEMLLILVLDQSNLRILGRIYSSFQIL